MPSINFMTRAELRAAGLSLKESNAVIDLRTRVGVIDNIEMLEQVTANLPAPTRRKLAELMAAQAAEAGSTTEAESSRSKLQHLALQLSPMPPMLSENGYKLHISWHRQTEFELFETTQPFTFRGPNSYDFYDVSFEHIIQLNIKDETGGTIAERVLIPYEERDKEFTMLRWRALPPLSESERVITDPPLLVAKLAIDTVRQPSHTTPPVTVQNDRFERYGRFQILGEPDFRFDGYTMSVALLKAQEVSELSVFLDTAAGTVANSIQASVTEPTTLSLLSKFSFRTAEVDFEGSFAIDRTFPDLSGVEGWLWVLTGPDILYGFQPDQLPATPQQDILILLGGGATSAATREVPYDVSEAALLNRPDLFSDDPGTSCQPFSNPGRILGEKRFYTVLRVTQPKVDRASSSAIYFEEQDDRPVDFPRPGVDKDNPVNYEDDPSLYQAHTVAIGHILEHAIRYRSNGYSLAEPAYSLTLAPRQKRRIMKLDYTRTERAQRDELTSSDDEVMDTLDRDRDYDNTVSSELNEWSRGQSRASATGVAGGAGFAMGGFVIGGGATHGTASSSSSQRGGREVAATETQHLRDSIRRYGQSLRTLESTVVTEMEQTESTEAVSEVVQNINYTRSLSIIYYEILRHLRVDTEIAGVSECIFVPMRIRPFTNARISRHRNALSRYARGWVERDVYRHLDDILADFSGSDIPDGTRAEQTLTELTGTLYVQLGINMPTEGAEFEEINEKTDREVYEREYLRLTESTYLNYAALLPFPTPILARSIAQASDADRERYFQGEVAPHMARTFLDTLEISSSTEILEADFTLASSYSYGRTLRVDFTVALDGSLNRNDLISATVKVSSGTNLPPRSWCNLISGQLRYGTDYYSSTARSNGGVRDLVNSTTGAPDPQGAALIFRLNSADQLHYRNRLREGYKELKKTLEENTFRYHKAIWWHMDRDELYTLLDGFSISSEDGRSLASMAERRPIGILGNSLIFRTKTDRPIDPMFATFTDLKNNYVAGLPPRDPMRISLPTGGLYARAHMDECIAAEEHNGSFDWVFDNAEPELADFPSNIFDSRRAEPQNLEPTQFPDSIISLQNAPAAPDVSGLSDAFAAVQNANAFRDMAGLEGTQANLRAALDGATNLANSFGNMAFQSKMAQIKADADAAKNIKAFTAATDAAADKKQISGETRTKANEKFINRLAEGGTSQTQAETAAENARTILEREGGGTQVSVTEDGARVVHKEPEQPKAPDPVADVSVVPIPPNQILFMNFATNSAALKTDHIRALEMLVGEVGLQLTDVVNIEGHASPAGDADYNEQLGFRRSESLFNKLYALLSPLNPSPDFSPDYISSTGEQGSYRERFSGIPAIANANGEGHPNDPVEKAVLFTFDPAITVTTQPARVIDFFGIDIEISGNFILMDNYIVVTTPENKLKFIDRSNNKILSEIDYSNIENTSNSETTSTSENTTVTQTETIKTTNNESVNVNLNFDFSNFSLLSNFDFSNLINLNLFNGNGDTTNVLINKDTGRADAETAETIAAADVEHDEWLLEFKPPKIEGPRNLFSIFGDVAELITGFDFSSQPDSDGTDELLSDIISDLSGAAADATKEVLVDILVRRLGLGPLVVIQESLELLQFGEISFKGKIKAKAHPDTYIEGTFAGPGIIFGSQTTASDTPILKDIDYSTSRKLKTSLLDDQGNFAEFGYLENGFLDSTLALLEGVDVLRTLTLPILPDNPLSDVVFDGIDTLIDLISDFAGGSGVKFKALTEDDGIKVSGSDVSATGLELRVIAIKPNKVGFTT